MDAESIVVTVDMTFADYDELCNLISTCADVFSDGPDPELLELASDFGYFSELLKSNRR